MSDAMMFDIARMPYEMAMSDEMSRRQFYANTQRLAAALEAAREDADRLAFLSKEPVIEGFVGIKKDIYDYASDCAEENGRDEFNDEDMFNGLRRLIDAAIEKERRRKRKA